jgi:hypothetical protein
LTIAAYSLALTAHRYDRPRDALTMLTEPDMQARYVAATLGVIEAELRKIVTAPADRGALFALLSGAARAARRLADDLAQAERGPMRDAVASCGASAVTGGNIVAFRR